MLHFTIAKHTQGSSFTLMLLVANLAIIKWCKIPEKWLKPWHMGTHLRVLSESYPMNINMIGFRWFSKVFGLALDWVKACEKVTSDLGLIGGFSWALNFRSNTYYWLICPLVAKIKTKEKCWETGSTWYWYWVVECWQALPEPVCIQFTWDRKRNNCVYI